MKQIGLFRNENIHVPLLKPHVPGKYEYLKCYGSEDYESYIETGVYVLDNDVEVEIKFSVDRLNTTSAVLFASSWYVEGHMFQIQQNDDDYVLMFNSTQGVNPSIDNLDYNEVYTVKQSLHQLYINGVAVSDTYDIYNLPFQDNPDSYTLKLAGITTGWSTNNMFKGNIYYVKIWKNGVLVRDMVPDVNSQNQVGLLDKLSRTYYLPADQNNWDIV